MVATLPHPIRWLDRQLAKATTLGLMQVFGLTLILLGASHWLFPVAELVVLNDAACFVVAWRCRREATRRDKAH